MCTPRPSALRCAGCLTTPLCPPFGGPQLGQPRFYCHSVRKWINPSVSNLPQTIMPSAYSPDTLLIHVCLMVDKWECGIHITSMMSGAYVGRGTCVVLRSIRVCWGGKPANGCLKLHASSRPLSPLRDSAIKRKSLCSILKSGIQDLSFRKCHSDTPWATIPRAPVVCGTPFSPHPDCRFLSRITRSIDSCSISYAYLDMAANMYPPAAET